jgi:riboflavin kinase / FMN adenylyltransferase
MAKETVKSSIATVGVFDGVHLGHVKILEIVSSRARELGLTAAVLTFDPHPDEVLGKLKTDRFLLTTQHEKEILITNLGIDVALVVEFTTTMARLDTASFVDEFLLNTLRLKELVVGHDFRMGRDRKGDRALLRSLGARSGFSVIDVEAVLVDGIPVSSTRVREAVKAGDMDLAAKLLGRGYSLEGVVVRGDGIGKSLGFPTANISVHERKLLPPDGVYAGYAEVGGRTFKAAINIGLRPSVRGGVRLVEAYLIGFGDGILGATVTITFVVRMRPEIKFPNREELKKAIAKDVEKIAYLLTPQ